MANVFAEDSKYAMPSSGKAKMTRPQIKSVISVAEKVCDADPGAILKAWRLTNKDSLARRIAVLIVREKTKWPAKIMAPHFNIGASSVDSVLSQARKCLRIGHAGYVEDFEVKVKEVKRLAGLE